MSDDLALMSATELGRRYRDRSLSPVEATKAALDRVATLNDRFNALCLVDERSALAAAKLSEDRWSKGEPLGPADGIPTTVKDLILTRGWPTLRGSKTIRIDQPWDVDAPSVARLRESGAVLIGKTTTPEYGWKGVTDSPLTGITRNPWNTEKTPGGSSGGAAVAAACGMGALHLGTDGGGSIRIPAAFTGIVGLKATFGRVPAFPASPFGTLANVGPMTRCVADAALMMLVIGQPDLRDWYAMSADHVDYQNGLETGVKGSRIAYSPSFAGQAVDPEVADLVAKAALAFRDLGATVDEQEAPVGPGCLTTFKNHWFSGAANAIRALSEEDRSLIDHGLLAIAKLGAKLSVLDYLAAVADREKLGLEMSRFFNRWALLLTPTLPLPAFQAGLEHPDAKAQRWTDWTPFTYPFNLTRQPAISVPCGRTRAGLPVGLQIVGPLMADRKVLQAARAFESIYSFEAPPV